jgi:hypothetical protein
LVTLTRLEDFIVPVTDALFLTALSAAVMRQIKPLSKGASALARSRLHLEAQLLKQGDRVALPALEVP